MKNLNDTLNKKIPIEFEKKFFKSSTIRFSKIYSITKEWQKYLLSMIIGMFIGMFTLFFLKNTGLYSMGVSAITQGFSRIITTILVLNNVDIGIISLTSDLTFWFLLFIFNIPLLFFAKKYIGNKFTYLTLVYLLTSAIFPFLLSLIPGIEEILFFGNIQTNLPGMPTNILILTWNEIDVAKVISLLFYAIIFPFVVVGFYTIIYAIGGSAGGSDILSIYYLKIKLKSLGKILVIINFFCVVFGSFVGSYLSIGILKNDWHYQYFFSPNLICSIFSFSIFGFLLQILYPRFKMVSIKIIGQNIEKINNHLDSIKCVHSRTISKAMGSYTKSDQYILEIYLTIIELGEIINEVRKIDDKAFIVVNKNIEIDGNLSYPIFLR